MNEALHLDDPGYQEVAERITRLRREYGQVRRQMYSAVLAECDAIREELREAEAAADAIMAHVYENAERMRRQSGEVAFQTIEDEYGVTREELTQPTRGQKRVWQARHELMRRLREDHDWTLKEIGFALAGRDHATVIHGIKMAKKRLAVDNSIDNGASAAQNVA